MILKWRKLWDSFQAPRVTNQLKDIQEKWVAWNLRKALNQIPNSSFRYWWQKQWLSTKCKASMKKWRVTQFMFNEKSHFVRGLGLIITKHTSIVWQRSDQERSRKVWPSLQSFLLASTRRHHCTGGTGGTSKTQSSTNTQTQHTHTLHLTPYTRQASNTYPLAKILNPEPPEASIIDSSFKTMELITECPNRRYEASCVRSLLVRSQRFCQT